VRSSTTDGIAATQAPDTAATATDEALAPLVALLAGRRFVALTGAGCSTESGIPDYRGGGRTGPRNPIQHDAFLRHVEVRRRYWARATLGWERFAGARPNAAHLALAALERDGALRGVITQNVDRLHRRAGSRRVVELHGALEEIRCLDCGQGEARDSVHARLVIANPGWLELAADVQPDGDADLPPEAVAAFRPVGCVACAGALKPDVVFFGGHVPEATLAAAWALLDEGEAVLVVASSLTVFSGFRFVRRAAELGLPVAVINIGPTRAEELFRDRAEGPCPYASVSARAGDALPRLARLLADSRQGQGDDGSGRG